MKEDLDADSAMFINEVKLVSKYDDKIVIEADDVLWQWNIYYNLRSYNRLIDADKAKAELLAIAETIPAWPGFFDGIRSGYQSAADRLDTMSVVEERKHGHWIELEPDKYGNFIQCNVCDSKFGLYSKDNYCQACGAIMENNGDDDDE